MKSLKSSKLRCDKPEVDEVLASFGLLFLEYCFFAISAGRLQIRRPKNWHGPRKEFTREKTTFAYYCIACLVYHQYHHDRACAHLI